MRNFTPELETVNLEEFLRFLHDSENFFNFVFTLREIAEKRREFLYFVGGVVRDYLLFKMRGNVTLPQGEKDIDIVLEGNLDAFLKEILKQIRGKILFKSQFLTFKVKFFLEKEELIVDFITARKEFYPDVAVLPVVSPGSFVDDILRRDFTVNTLALGLTPPYKEVIIDLLRAKEDLKKGIIKPLHSESFVDDPTRIFRGIRYATRLNFRFSKEFNEALAKAYKTESLKKLTPARIYNEFELFVKKEPIDTLDRLFSTACDLGIFRELSFKVKKNVIFEGVELFKSTKESIKPKFWTKALLLYFVTEESEIDNLVRFNFTDKEIEKVKRTFKEFESLNEFDEEKVFELLERTENWINFGLVSKVKNLRLRKALKEYLQKFLSIKPELSGEDLKNLGIREGRLIGKILRLLKIKRLKKEILDKNQELEWVKNYVSQLK